jgi:hypothetical protein
MTTAVTDRFYIEGTTHPRPAAARVIYADGAGAGQVRAGADIELSHWVPNQTAAEFKADSSTEICLRYTASASRRDADLVVNDHADVDGFLALYALLESDTALEHSETLVGAAEMGDFLAWAERPAFRLSQELSLLLLGADRPADVGDCYAEAMKIVTGVLDGSRSEAPAITAGWKLIERGCERIARGDVCVESITDHLVSFVYPAGVERAAALKIPLLNAIVDDSVWLWPQVRNREHGQRVQIVSVPAGDGWLHDVWMPSYSWAETPDRWTAPGLVSTGDSNVWNVDHEPLRRAAAELGRLETATGRWVSADRLTPWTSMSGRAFPVVLSFLGADDDQPAPSNLDPERIAGVLKPVWDGAARQ